MITHKTTSGCSLAAHLTDPDHHGDRVLLSTFPDPHPDELFYHVEARYGERAWYPDRQTLNADLHSMPNAGAIVDLPHGLDGLVASLPVEGSLTADRIIDDHTLLPYYAPWLPQDRVDRLREDMRGDGRFVHMRAGIMASRLHLPEYLRFCAMCVPADRAERGEAYWHRLHQAPGVEVCPTHEVFLQRSGVRMRHTRMRRAFVSAESALDGLPMMILVLDRSDPSHAALLRLARDTERLLARRGYGPGLDALRDRYLRLLADRGLAYHDGKVRITALEAAFAAHYPGELLASLGCGINAERRETWLQTLVRTTHAAQHPLYHLLFVQFLGVDVDDILDVGGPTPEKQTHFGRGPWPCLNTASDHYHEPCVAQCVTGRTDAGGKPVGMFACTTCGFTYRRTGPDRTTRDCYRIGVVLDYGSIWTRTLRTLWADENVSLGEIGRRLGVSALTVRRQAARLELPFPRAATSSRPASGGPPRHGLRTDIDRASITAKHKAAWLATREASPTANRKTLHRRLPAADKWLRAHEPEWLEQHMPPAQRSMNPGIPREPWDARDARLASMVRAAATYLLNRDEACKRVTTSAIGAYLGLLGVLRHRDKLPQTTAMLADVIETREQWALRRITWAVEYYRREGIRPAAWLLWKRVNVGGDLARIPSVRAAFDEAMHEFSSLTSLFLGDATP